MSELLRKVRSRYPFGAMTRSSLCRCREPNVASRSGAAYCATCGRPLPWAKGGRSSYIPPWHRRVHVFRCVDEGPRTFGIACFPLAVCISLHPSAWHFSAPTPTQNELWHGTFGFVSVAWGRTARGTAKRHLALVSLARRRGEQPVCVCHREVW